MNFTHHWPKHFYLVASGQTPPHHKPTRENMGSKAHNLLLEQDAAEEERFDELEEEEKLRK